jgi:hypothetical protein
MPKIVLIEHAKKFYKFFDRFTLTMGMGTDRYYTYEWKKISLSKGDFKVTKVDKWITSPCNCDPNPLAMRCFQKCEICGNKPLEGDFHCNYTQYINNRNANFVEDLNKYAFEQKKWIKKENENASKEECYKRMNIFVNMLKINLDETCLFTISLIEEEANHPL